MYNVAKVRKALEYYFLKYSPFPVLMCCVLTYYPLKVAKGEILVYFNELFDAMSKVSHGQTFVYADSSADT